MQDIKKKLVSVPAEYQPAPFWSWNDKLEPEELTRQIQWMQDMGIGGFFMHARGGLKTPYMSEEWMECITACCEEAKRLGMQAWGYDENGWPSGFAGGKLLENEENRDRYITHSIGKYDEKADLTYPLEDNKYLNLYIGRSVSTVDILNPSVVKQFIALTHEKYKEHFGEEFPRMMRGFFTDEPQFYRGGGTPYSDMLPEYFQSQYGEDIREKLELLFVEKEGYESFRYRYWLSMQQLMLQSFAKQIYEWCEENGVQLTGHYIEESCLAQQVSCCGGIMPFYRYMHIPGIDWLIGETDSELAPRQVGSVASQMGKEHVLTETFAGRGWNATPEELRRIAGFQYVNGVNFLCHHLLPYSEHGQRKRDYPIHFSSVNPWIKDEFGAFNNYFSRLGYLLASGKEQVNVAILHPIRSAYFGKQIEELKRSLEDTMRALSSKGIAFHFLDETLLETDGFTKEGVIGCGACSYEYLIFPKMLTMGKHTEELVRTFVQGGGKILLYDGKPYYLEGESFDYDYLESNCSLADILDTQPFRVKETNNRLYYAFRRMGKTSFLFVQNASKDHAYQQTFSFADNSQSLIGLDLVTLEEKELPLTVSLQANQAMLLFPVRKNVPKNAELKRETFRFENAEVEFDDNYLTIDSEPIYVGALFQKLLEQRYDGKLWLRYAFEVESIPKSLELMAEKDNMADGAVNGHPIHFIHKWEKDSSIYLADILEFVREGVNFYETVVQWKQSEETYYALFGENVTESLKNCISYEGEIEAVYLKGHFGVYTHREWIEDEKESVCGNDFYIGAAPKFVNEPTTDGFPFFRGKLKCSQTVCFENNPALLHVEGNYLTAKVWINGECVGKLMFEREIDVSPYVIKGANQIEIEFTIGNRNLFGPLHKEREEWLLCPWDFDCYDMPEYQLQQFYKKEEKKHEENE